METGAVVSPSTSKDPPSDTSPSLKKAPPNKAPPKKRGFRSRAKRAEQGRAKINEKIHLEIQNRALSEATANIEVLFGSRRLTPSYKPTLLFHIYTDKIIELCTYTADVLHRACKISPPTNINVPNATDYDADTLIFVTAHQIASKIMHARAGSKFADVDDIRRGITQLSFSKMQRTSLHLSRTLLPIAAAIDHIGKFVLNGQTYIPSLVLDRSGSIDHLTLQNVGRNLACQYVACFRGLIPNTIPVPGRMGPNGHPLGIRVLNVEQAMARNIIAQDGTVNPLFLTNPEEFQWFDVLEIIEQPEELAVPTYVRTINRYAELMGRIERKLSSAVFRDVNLASGLGTAAQLVVCEPNENQLCTVWCSRSVGDIDLEFGGILQFGVEHQPLGLRACASVEAQIDVAGALVSMANVLTKRQK